MIICGIDTGISGGIAFYKHGELFKAYDMPVMAAKHKKGNQVDSKALYDLLSEFKPDLVTIERVWQLPKQSAQSGFSFGGSFQAVISCVEILGLNHEYITPQQWINHFSLRGKKKGVGFKSTHIVPLLYPDVEVKGPRGGIKDGRCDAVLIALYGGCRFYPESLREHKDRNIGAEPT